MRTTEEFSSSRKIRYGLGASKDDTNNKSPSTPLSSAGRYTSPSLTPHKHFYGVDATDGQRTYYIEFNIGAFAFDEISIRTEGNGQRLVVQGASKLGDEHQSEEIKREFKREFTLPADVDPNTIKAQVDESTRLLTLSGKCRPPRAASAAPTDSTAPPASTEAPKSTSSSSVATSLNIKNESTAASKQKAETFLLVNQTSELSSPPPPAIGSVKETRHTSTSTSSVVNQVDYEIYLGGELSQDGQVNLELYSTPHSTAPSQYTLTARVETLPVEDDYGEYQFQLKRQLKLPAGADPSRLDHYVDTRRACLVINVPLLVAATL